MVVGVGFERPDAQERESGLRTKANGMRADEPSCHQPSLPSQGVGGWEKKTRILDVAQSTPILTERRKVDGKYV